jgi:hypothetical protein
MKCPHCPDSTLVDHETFAPKTDGAMHCFECGCCYLLDGVTPRPGVPVCALARETVTEAATEEKPVSRMNKSELLAFAASLGLAVDDSATVAQLREFLSEEAERDAGVLAPVVPPVGAV